MLQDEDSFQLAIYRKHSRKKVDLNRSSSLPATKSSPSSPVVSSNNTYELLNTATGRSSSSSSKKKRKRKSRTPLSTVSTPSAPASPFLPETDDIPHGSGNNKENEPEASKGHGDDKNTHDTSEPASPLSPSSTVAATTTTFTNMSFSFWDYLRDEITVSDFDSTQEIKRERITNFFGVPGAIEKLMAFGFVVCLDSFLYTFTILPLRFFVALYHYSCHLKENLKVLVKGQGRFPRLRPSQKCDLLKGFLVIITCVIMSSLDPSRIYHSIRGQAVLKLYVIFNVLEVFDKLCCSVGSDILDALFSKSTLGNPEHGSMDGTVYAKRQLKPITLFLLATGYMVIHTSVLFFEMITLNVAINFYSNALLSLLISNQFVEIKQSVFKKFEKENLFQLSCSDVVERFQQLAFLLIITVRNVIELSESPPSSVLPSTFVPLIKLPATTTLNALMTPVLMVIASELMVDWLKHAFITKFNHIRPSIYGKYIDVLCKDLVIGSPGRLGARRNAFIDQSPVVSRRIGFPALPLACLHIRMVQQLMPMLVVGHGDNSSGDGSYTLAAWIANGFLSYLTDHSSFIRWILPTRVQFIVLSMVRRGWLERGLDKGFKVIAQLIIWGTIAVCLLALKVLVGITLLGYAYKRYASMAAREMAENEKDKQVKEMNKDEEQYNKDLRNYLNDPEDNVMGLKPIKYTLENVDRFSMVRSRIP